MSDEDKLTDEPESRKDELGLLASWRDDPDPYGHHGIPLETRLREMLVIKASKWMDKL